MGSKKHILKSYGAGQGKVTSGGKKGGFIKTKSLRKTIP